MMRSAPPRTRSFHQFGRTRGRGVARGEIGDETFTAAALPGLRTAFRCASCEVEFREVFAVDVDVLIPTHGDVDDKYLAFRIARAPKRFGERVRRFERRDDALSVRESCSAAVSASPSGSGHVLGAVLVM